jgi:hypothetical protein
VCFSPEADLVGGLVVTGAGVDAVRHLRHKREIGMALLPLAFGAHQVIEALAWWGLGGVVPEEVGEAAAWLYLLIAFLLPLAVPLVVRAVEDDPVRRGIMAGFAALGGAVAAALIVQLADGPLVVRDAGRYLDYDAGLTYGGVIAALYIAAVCVPLLASSIGRIRLFGAANLAAVLALAWLLSSGLISLWCAWAAVTSIVIALHLRTAPGDGTPTRVHGTGTEAAAGR